MATPSHQLGQQPSRALAEVDSKGLTTTPEYCALSIHTLWPVLNGHDGEAAADTPTGDPVPGPAVEPEDTTAVGGVDQGRFDEGVEGRFLQQSRPRRR